MQLVARSLYFGLTFNSSATCIAPRRVFVTRADHPALAQAIRTVFADAPKVAVTQAAYAQLQNLLAEGSQDVCPLAGDAALPEPAGDAAQMQPLVLDQVPVDSPLAAMDIFAPVASVLVCDTAQEMIAIAARCPFALGASVFGPRKTATLFAQQVDAGHVAVNDLVVPTADPRLCFGGRGASGHGVTRGMEGLLAMTQPKVITVRRSCWRAHLAKPDATQARLLRALIGLTHGPRWSQRWQAIKAFAGKG